jgi:hypothetical protein
MDEWELEVSQVTACPPPPSSFHSVLKFNSAANFLISAVPIFLNEFLHVLHLFPILLLFLNSNITRIPFYSLSSFPSFLPFQAASVEALLFSFPSRFSNP